jgi:hypothetical protein
MATPEKCLFVFTSRLGCKKDLGSVNTNEKSQLPCFLENESSECTLPSLSLGKCACTKSCEQEAVDELKSALQLRKETISLAPTTLLKNVSCSFGTMIDDRIKQVHLLLLATSHENNNKENEQTLKLLSLLLTEKTSPASFTSAESCFRPLSIKKGFVKTIGRLKAVILPLVFSTTIHIKLLGIKSIKVCIAAPGTITGIFFGTSIRLRSAEVTIDTAALHQCMKARCDKVAAEVFETAALLSDIQSSNGDLERLKKPKEATSPIDGGLCSSSQRRDLSNSGRIIPISH